MPSLPLYDAAAPVVLHLLAHQPSNQTWWVSRVVFEGAIVFFAVYLGVAGGQSPPRQLLGTNPWSCSDWKRSQRQPQSSAPSMQV